MIKKEVPRFLGCINRMFKKKPHKQEKIELFNTVNGIGYDLNEYYWRYRILLQRLEKWISQGKEWKKLVPFGQWKGAISANKWTSTGKVKMMRCKDRNYIIFDALICNFLCISS